MINSGDPDQLASPDLDLHSTDLDLHVLLRQGMSCSAREGLGCIKTKGEDTREKNWFKSPVVFLLTVPRWFLCCSSSMSVRVWIHMWSLSLCFHYLFLITSTLGDSGVLCHHENIPI